MDDLIEALSLFNDAGRFLVVQFRNGSPLAVDVHRAIPEAAGYIRKSVEDFKIKDAYTYCNVFAGIRLYFSPEKRLWVPYLPERD